MTLCEPLSQAIFLVKSGHDVLPSSREDQFQEVPAKEATLRAPLLGSLSSLPPFIREITFFCLELELFILIQAWAWASQWASFVCPWCFPAIAQLVITVLLQQRLMFLRDRGALSHLPELYVSFSTRCAFFSTISSLSVARRMRGKNESLCPPRTWAANGAPPVRWASLEKRGWGKRQPR